MQPWTARQRVAVMLLIGGIVALTAVRFAFNPTYISDPQPAVPLRQNELADKLDPNTADAASLSVLPLIGDKKAEDIIRFREKFVSTHPGQVAFRRPLDLLLIHGIGQATVEQLKPYLIFPDEPTTRASQ